MKTTRITLFYLTIFSFAILFSCNEKEDSCTTFDAIYEGAVGQIINRSCATTGCHDGTGNTGIPLNSTDFSTYSRLKTSVLDNGKFNKRVFEDVDMPMPPIGFTQVPLTELEGVILRCWMDNNFPEN